VTSEPDPVVYPVPQRPCLSPRPQVALVCFSPDNMDSFVEVETMVVPDLRLRYGPELALVLVATRCDVRDAAQR
jgi:GTPase SAR1 family protein